MSENDREQWRRLDHEMHVNINRRQDRLRESAEAPFEHWLYEAKDALNELRRLPLLFRQLREGKLPQTYRHCSHSPEEPLTVENKLVCCLGQNVAECPWLRDVFDGLEGKFRPELIDAAKAGVCVMHIAFESGRRGCYSLDGNEGYIQDETDRMFWDRTYAIMAAREEEPDA